VIKVARTIADMAGADVIGAEYISEAIQYRSMDRNLWVWLSLRPNHTIESNGLVRGVCIGEGIRSSPVKTGGVQPNPWPSCQV
jgi:hypothetical protein